MKKVIILHPSQLSYRWIKYLCIDGLIEKKVEMEYWDCSAIDSLPLYSMDNIERAYLREIRSLNDLKKKCLSKIETNVFMLICFIGLWLIIRFKE